MSEPKWTPGPWRTQPCSAGGCLVIRGEYGQHAQSHVQIVPAEDARLIAEAPEMYDMLEEAARQIQYLHEKFQYTGSGEAVLAQIEHVLARARGESHE